VQRNQDIFATISAARLQLQHVIDHTSTMLHYLRIAVTALSVAACVVPVIAVVGCWGDAAADRSLKIYQLQSTETYGGQFQIDTSQLPPDAIVKRNDSGGVGRPVTSLTIDQKYPIRVVLVPVTDEESKTEDNSPHNEQ
jgi:hypothetical protein